MVPICMGRFGLSLIEAKRCTPSDFEIYAKAHSIELLEKQHFIAIQSFMNEKMQETTGSGKNAKRKNRRVTDLFDYNKEFNKLFMSHEQAKTNHKITMADRNRLLRKGGN